MEDFIKDLLQQILICDVVGSVGTRIYNIVAPPGTTTPYLVFKIVDFKPIRTMNARNKHDGIYSVSFRSFDEATSVDTTVTIADLLVAHFEGIQFDVGLNHAVERGFLAAGPSISRVNPYWVSETHFDFYVVYTGD